ncbi:ECF transporter S component [Anaerotruncus colihominis]|uniref:ECF transporter S component n=1 Tax=Anaerotruncus colihominis TaxID=169435 RepID=A0A845RLB7_9FIRM|nr:ECF transporter S component [Anaerotruncus colihominis]NBI80333.1 ECF transporter S component [Anaerotruncus colihominis]
MTTATIRRTTRLTQLSLLAALLAVLGFTPIGFIIIPPVSITLMHIPVIIGAILLGPLDGAILGGIFGFISLFKAVTTPGGPVDLLFSPAASGAPLNSLIMCLVPRILLGVIAALVYKAVRRAGMRPELCTGAAAAAATIAHTVMVLGCLWLFFQAIPLKEVFLTIIGVNGLCELAAAIILSVFVCRPVQIFLKAGR